MGKGRTTTGMILACLLKDILFGNNDIIYYKDDKVTTEEFPDEDEYLEEVRICLEKWKIQTKTQINSLYIMSFASAFNTYMGMAISKKTKQV